MEPIITDHNGRTKNGRFAKGNSGGPGRPRRPDLYTLVTERAAAEGVDLETQLWKVCQSLIAQARDGNVQAARLLFNHLCIEPVSQRDISLNLEEKAGLSDVEIASRMQCIFAAAADRLESLGESEEANRMRAAVGARQISLGQS